MHLKKIWFEFDFNYAFLIIYVTAFHKYKDHVRHPR